MPYRPSLPWLKIHEYFLKIGQKDQPLEFCQEAALELKELTPYDAAYIFFLDDRLQLKGHHVIGAPEKKVKAFIDYYVKIDPCKQRTPPNAKTWTIDWNEFHHTEFCTDWGRQVDLSFTASMYLHNQKQLPGAIMFITRSGHKGFNERELAIWEVLQPHMSNHYKLIEKIQPTINPLEIIQPESVNKQIFLVPFGKDRNYHRSNEWQCLSEQFFQPLNAGINLNTSPTDQICFQTLGSLIILKDRVEITPNWRTLKSRDLLAYFIHKGQPVSKDVIIEELWFDYDLEKSSSLFHTVLYYLRRTLNQIGLNNLVAYQNGMYSIRTEYNDESQDFKKLVSIGLRRELEPEIICNLLEKAVGLYRGNYLDELDYPWLTTTRENMRDLYYQALYRVAACYYNKGEYYRVIHHLEQAIDVNPLSEEAYQLMMNTYAALSDQKAIRQLFQRLKNDLSEELGIAPTKETVRLYEKLCSTRLC